MKAIAGHPFGIRCNKCMSHRLEVLVIGGHGEGRRSYVRCRECAYRFSTLSPTVHSLNPSPEVLMDYQAYKSRARKTEVSGDEQEG